MIEDIATGVPSLVLASSEELGDPSGRPSLRASVVIVSYNSRAYLAPCLQALQRSTGQDLEILVVDNASSDGSASYVEGAFPAVRVLRSETNLGFGAGGNLGAAQARGRTLAFLNPDTVVEPGWLEALIAALEADPQAGLATSKIVLLQDPQRINTCGNDVHLTGLTLCRGMGLESSALAEPQEVGAVSGAAFAIGRDLFAQLGGFDETFFLYMEDTDLSWRARLAGRRCLYVPASLVQHDYALRFGPLKTFYQERNRYLLLLKSLRWRTLLVLLPALLLAEAVTWGFILLQEPRRWANKLRAYRWIVAHWGQVMASRSRTQALRQVHDRDLLAISTYRLAFEQSASGPVPRLASLVLNPLFYLLRRLALTIIRW